MGDSLRRRVWRQLDVRAWPGARVSPVNKSIVLAILVGTGIVILETEPALSAWAPWFARVEAGLGLVFGSIPRALWWSVVTLTTIGYGDVFPVTPAGKVVAGLVAVAGIGLIAMPTGILAAAFSESFRREREGLDAKD